MPPPFDPPLSIRAGEMGLRWEQHCATALARHQLAPMEYRLLFLLAQRGSATAAQLAPELPIDPSYISRTVQRLVERTLLRRRRGRQDRRQVQLRLSAAGLELIETATVTLRELDDALAHEGNRDLLDGLIRQARELPPTSGRAAGEPPDA
ncbi:MAG: MarR family winged helix-turn-helix transcriptional regulator [Chloroflexi bacterium]|nr:MarR family winged helix-turn-helix transcriptional regulator [Chloroflexota bacterium]